MLNNLNRKDIYLDNAATSFPKPDSVIDSVVYFMQNVGANPGRSGHRKSIEAGKIIFKARRLIANFFGIKNPMRVIHTFNATDALNLIIKGIVKIDDHFISTTMEHNSVLRVLSKLKKNNLIDFDLIEASKNGKINPNSIKEKIKKNTKAVIVNHASNVNGIVQNIDEIGKICEKHETLFIVDAAQSAGIIPIDMIKSKIDALVFAGHKSLYGPTGTGGLVLNDNFDISKLSTLREGGTGSFSEKVVQPDFLPDKYESGTLNVAGIAGLIEGINFVKQKQMENIYKQKIHLLRYFVNNAEKSILGFRSFTDINEKNTGIISFRIDNFSVSELTELLSEKFNIMTRQGLHCAPLAHKSLGSFPEGTVRISLSAFSVKSEIDIVLNSLKKIVSCKKQ